MSDMQEQPTLNTSQEQEQSTLKALWAFFKGSKSQPVEDKPVVKEKEDLNKEQEPTNEDMENYINLRINDLVNAEVNKRLAGSTPKANTTKQEVVTKEQFDRMTYKERLKMFNESPQTYNKLIGGLK